MDTTILDFLKSQRISTLAVLLPDSTVHGATLHYSHQAEPLKLFFSTENTSKKTQGLLDGASTSASVVVGFSEEEWITLQLDGTVKAILDPEELKQAKAIHYAKHPNSQKFENAPETIFLAFTPNWWRYTDYNIKPLKIIESQ